MMNILRIATFTAFVLIHTVSFARSAEFWSTAAGTNCKAAIQTANVGASRDDCLLSMLPIPDPCGKFGKLFSAAVGIGAGLAGGGERNSFAQDTLVHTRIQTDSGYQTKLKPIKDIQVGDEVLAWDDLQAHDNAQLAQSGQAAQTLQGAYQQAVLGDKSASILINTGASSYENKSNFSSLGSVKPAQRYEKVTDTISSFKEQTLLHISLSNGQTIQATAGHPFKTQEGWRDAVLLKKGGQLLLGGESDAAERYATILEIREEVKTTAVFNLEVANLHTFFVGVEGLVVHNAKKADSYKEKSGGWDRAERIFDRVAETVTINCGQKKVGRTRDGKAVNLHASTSKHSYGAPTIEVRDAAGTATSKHRY